MDTAARIRILIVALPLLLAGCPFQAPDNTAQTPVSSGSGAPPASDSGSPAVGPPAGGDSATDGDGATENPAGSTLPAVIGGDTSDATAFPDALTVDYPGCDEPVEAAFWRSEVLRLVNVERVAGGLDPVVTNATLEDQATQYACELIFYDFFGHENPSTGSTLKDRAGEFGYVYWIIGENLAAGQLSPAAAVADWMDSPCHRENIMNPVFTELGIGIRYGGDYGYYWVQEFGRPFTAEQPTEPTYQDPECEH